MKGTESAVECADAAVGLAKMFFSKRGCAIPVMYLDRNRIFSYIIDH